jgi:hypothetical protein
MLLDFSSALSMPSLSCKTRITKEEKLFLQQNNKKETENTFLMKFK